MTLPLSAVASILSTRFTIQAQGVGFFASLSLLLTLPTLLPFADLGSGAALVNAAADPECANLDATVAAALKRAVSSAAVIVFASVILALTGRWSQLLGSANTGARGDLNAIALTLGIVFAISVVLGLGQRLLTGLGAVALSSLLTATQPVLTCLVLASVRLAGGRLTPWAIVAAFSAGALLPGSLQLYVGTRRAGIGLTRCLGQITKAHSGLLKGTATPMIIISAAVPITYQGGRWLLAHRSSIDEVAVFAAVLQLWTTGLALVSTIGQVYWATFARNRGRQRQVWPAAFKMSIGVGSLMFLGWAFTAQLVFGLITDHRLHLSFATVILAGACLALEAGHQPSGMLLTYPAGLIFQAKTTVAAAGATVALTWALAPALGASSPFLALLLGYGFLQVLPCFWRVLRTSDAAIALAV